MSIQPKGSGEIPAETVRVRRRPVRRHRQRGLNACMADHIHGEDGCTGCDDSRGPAGHDWEARMRTITEM